MNVVRGGVLDPAHRARWAELQEGDPTFSSPYYRPEYTEAVAAVRNDVYVAEIASEGEVAGFFPFQRTRLGLGLSIGGARTNYDGPIVGPSLRLDAEELIRACGLASYSFHSVPLPLSPFASHHRSVAASSVVDLDDGFDGYVESRRGDGSRVVARIERQARRLEREFGPLSFEADNRDPGLLALLMAWKSAQYRRTGCHDRCSIPWTVALLERIHRADEPCFGGLLSVLAADERVVALVLTLRSHAAWHGWFQAYDPELVTYSPGMILLLRLIEEAGRRGVRRFDLGTGEMGFKSRLRTSVVELGAGSVIASPRGAALLGLRDGCNALATRIPAPSSLRSATLQLRLRLGGAAFA